MMQLADQQDCIHTTLDEFLDLTKLLIEVIFEQASSSVCRLRLPALQAVDGAGEVAVGEGRKDGANRTSAARGKRPRDAIRHPSEPLDHGGNPFLQFRRDQFRIVHGARNGRGRNASDFGDFTQAHSARWFGRSAFLPAHREHSSAEPASASRERNHDPTTISSRLR